MGFAGAAAGGPQVGKLSEEDTRQMTRKALGAIALVAAMSITGFAAADEVSDKRGAVAAACVGSGANKSTCQNAVKAFVVALKAKYPNDTKAVDGALGNLVYELLGSVNLSELPAAAREILAAGLKEAADGVTDTAQKANITSVSTAVETGTPIPTIDVVRQNSASQNTI